LYCYSEKIAITIRFFKKLSNGKYLVEEDELIPYSPNLTPNGKIVILLEVTYCQVIETTAPLVVLMDAQPFVMI
jgi:hypothetical protein